MRVKALCCHWRSRWRWRSSPTPSYGQSEAAARGAGRRPASTAGLRGYGQASGFYPGSHSRSGSGCETRSTTALACAGSNPGCGTRGRLLERQPRPEAQQGASSAEERQMAPRPDPGAPVAASAGASEDARASARRVPGSHLPLAVPDQGQGLAEAMRRWTPIAAIVAIVLWACASAAASWPGDGSGSGYAGAKTMPAGNVPTATVSGRDVSLSWTASSGSVPVDGYVVKRYDTGDTEHSVGADCSGTVSGTSCIEHGVDPGDWRYTITPARINWRGAESPKSDAVTVDASRAGPRFLVRRQPPEHAHRADHRLQDGSGGELPARRPEHRAGPVREHHPQPRAGRRERERLGHGPRRHRERLAHHLRRGRPGRLGGRAGDRRRADHDLDLRLGRPRRLVRDGVESVRASLIRQRRQDRDQRQPAERVQQLAIPPVRPQLAAPGRLERVRCDFQLQLRRGGRRPDRLLLLRGPSHLDRQRDRDPRQRREPGGLPDRRPP